MKRREFLKLVGIAIIAPSLPTQKAITKVAKGRTVKAVIYDEFAVVDRKIYHIDLGYNTIMINKNFEGFHIKK